MAYDATMAAVSTNDAISAAMWNAHVNNIDFLHDTREMIQVAPISATGLTLTGDWYAPQTNNINASTHTVFPFAIPANFGSLISAVIVMFSTTSYTAEYDINADFGANTESYNANSGAIANQTVALTANKLKEIDVSSALTGLAASDYASVRISNSTGANAGNWQAVLLVLVYTRSDSTP